MAVQFRRGASEEAHSSYIGQVRRASTYLVAGLKDFVVHGYSTDARRLAGWLWLPPGMSHSLVYVYHMHIPK